MKRPADGAPALILYRFAVAAASTGMCSFGRAAGTFALIVVGEIVFGVFIGWLSVSIAAWATGNRGRRRRSPEREREIASKADVPEEPAS